MTVDYDKPYNYPDDQEFMSVYMRFSKGNPERAKSSLYSAMAYQKGNDGNPITWNQIKSKWLQYLELCAKEEREDRYIKSMESWIMDKEFNSFYDYKLDGQGNMKFLDKWLNIKKKD